MSPVAGARQEEQTAQVPGPYELEGDIMKALLSTLLATTLALCVIEADAGTTPGERRIALTIEAASLATALDQWAQQSGFQIFVDGEVTRNLTAPAVIGTFKA